MRTIVSGPVTQEHLDDADLLSGIEPSSFVTDGRSTPPASNLVTTVFPPCPKIGGQLATDARDYTLCQNADALVLVGRNDHLLRVARQYRLAVHEA